MSFFTYSKFFLSSSIYILVVLILLHTSFSSIFDDDEIDYDNLDFNTLDPSLISQIDWSRVDFSRIDFSNFRFWHNIPPNFIYRVPANDLDYSQLIVPDQTIEMTPMQIQANIYNIENLFTDVNSHHVESILLNKFTNSRGLGIRFSIQGDVKLLEDGSLVTPRMISQGIQPLNINDNSFIQEIIITDDGSIRVEEIVTATETIGGITFATEDQDPVEPKGNIDELNLGDIQRDIIDPDTGEKISLSDGAVRIEDGRVLISSELGSITSQGAIITLQSEFPELVGIGTSEDGSLSFDSSRLSSNSQARLETILRNSQNLDPSIANIPALELSSISPQRDTVNLRDDITQIGNAFVEGSAEDGYELREENGRISGALNIDGTRRTFEAQGLQEEDRIFTQRLDDRTAVLRATQEVQVDIDKSTQHSYTLIGSSTQDTLKNSQGGIRLTNTIGSAIWESNSRGLIGTSTQTSRVGVTNRGQDLVFTSSTQDNCQGFSNCRITSTSLVNGVPTQFIQTTVGTSGDVIFEHFDDYRRIFTNEVKEGGFLRQTFHENEEFRFSVDTTSNSVDVRHGFLQNSVEIISLFESGQMQFISSQGSNIQTGVRSDIHEFILQNQQGYDTSVFLQNSLQDALIKLGLSDTSSTRIRELYQILFDKEPPLNDEQVEDELLQLLSQGSGIAFSNVNINALERTQVGTIFEEMSLGGLNIGSRVQQLRVNQEGNGIDPQSLIAPIYTSTLEILVTQDSSSIFSGLSSQEQQDITLVLQQLGIESPSEQMKQELYRALIGEFPRSDMTAAQRDERLLQALRSNEFQTQFNDLNNDFRLEAQERGVSVSQVIEESQRDVAQYNLILSQSLEQHIDCSQVRGGCSRLVNTGVGLSSQVLSNPQDLETNVLRWAEVFQNAIISSGGSLEEARQVVVSSIDNGILNVIFSNTQISLSQEQELIRRIQERS